MTKLNRPMLYLGVVVVVGAAIWWLERPGVGPSDDRTQVVFFPTLDPLQVKKLQISHLMDGVTLQKEGDVWMATPSATKLSQQVDVQNKVAPVPAASVVADPWKVGAALRTLKELTAQSIISRDAQNAPQLQANDIGTHVEAYDAAGQVLADIYIGKAGPDLISTAVRREGEQTVYLAKGYLASQFPAVLEPWKQNEKVDHPNDRSSSATRAAPGGQ